ncbi:MAG: LysM peptidoglycan-binding domain-containing protein [Acidobacteriota bacterium]
MSIPKTPVPFPSILRSLAPPLTLLLLAPLGCASSGSDGGSGGTVRIVSDLPADVAEPAAQADDGAGVGDPGDSPAADLVLEAIGTPLDGDRPSGVRDVLEQAIAWAGDGVRLYRNGDLEEARDHLRDARIALLDADLPEVMQEQGLSVLDCALGSELGRVDLEAIAQELEDGLADDGTLAEEAYIEREARRILARFGETSPKPESLATFVDEIGRYVEFYKGHQRSFFERAYGRKHKYWPVITAVFEAKGIPAEQGYMALVESGFNPRARSHANAQGLWQFIPSTGKRYGLRNRQDLYDVEKSTEAAAEYLLDLIGIFGSRSFMLATAAYNAGEGRIMRCLRTLDDPFGGRDFWAIRDCLAPETQQYVPRIFAAAIVASDPARFGFDLPGPEQIAESYDVVTIPDPTRLATIARRSGTTVAELRTANTDLPSSASSTPVRNFPLYVPKGGGERLIGSLAAGPAPSGRSTEMTLAEQMGATPPGERLGTDTRGNDGLRPPRGGGGGSTGGAASETRRGGPRFEYRVKQGDTLGGIAEEFGVSVADLERWNPFLGRRVLYRGDRLTVHPPEGAVRTVTHRVRRGESLSTIAEQHGVPWRDIAKWNGLSRPYRLKIGQELAVYPRGAAPSGLVYTVQRGNTLQTIAQIFSVRYRDVMAWNDLRSSRLSVGQELRIRPPRAFERRRHRVRRGETVAVIARRYGVAVRDVLTANGLGARSLIRPGDRLDIYVPS